MNNILIYYSCLDFDKNSNSKKIPDGPRKNHTESNIYPNEKKANANPRLRNIINYDRRSWVS